MNTRYWHALVEIVAWVLIGEVLTFGFAAFVDTDDTVIVKPIHVIVTGQVILIMAIFVIVWEQLDLRKTVGHRRK